MGELRLGALIGFKFVKDGGEFFLLILGKKGVDSLLRRLFSRLLGLLGFLIVGVGISGVDLHHIMDEAHQHDFCDVHLFIGVLLKEIGHDGHVPGVFGVIFTAAVPG